MFCNPVRHITKSCATGQRTVVAHGSLTCLGTGLCFGTNPFGTYPFNSDPKDGTSMLFRNAGTNILHFHTDYQNMINIFPDLLLLWPINK